MPARRLDTDKGLRRLGEVALVTNPLPIARSGLLFPDTPFDEDATCLIAMSFTHRSAW